MALSSELKLLFACSGIFFSFSYFAVLQEDVYAKDYGGEKFRYTFLALAVERSINAAIAALGVMLLGPSGTIVPLREIFNSGISQMLAMAASNESLRFVSFPTQVLGKSCKMVPVMVGGIVLGGKWQEYKLIDYIQVLLITLGVCVFNFGGKAKKGGEDSLVGFALIGASLVMDAITGGLQDKVKARAKALNPEIKGAKPSMHESMLWTNASGCIVAAGLGLITGQLIEGITFCTRHPEVLRAVLLYSISSAVGQNFIYYTITQFNPLVLTTVTTTRKIFSTVYSVLRNPANSLATMQWAGCACVFAGLAVDVLVKVVGGQKRVAQAPPPSATNAVKGSPKTRRTQKVD